MRDFARVEPTEIHVRHGFRECIHALVDEDAGPAVDHRLPDAARVHRQYWASRRLGLNRSDAELLDVRNDERRGACIEPGELLVCYSSEKLRRACVLRV